MILLTKNVYRQGILFYTQNNKHVTPKIEINLTYLFSSDFQSYLSSL